MSVVALTCPQCSGPLPRQASWRTVVCPYCHVTVVRGEEVVHRASFRAAYERALQTSAAGARIVTINDSRYRVLGALSSGKTAEVLLGERLGPLIQRVVIKLSQAAGKGTPLEREARTLRALQALRGPGTAYFTTRLPEVVTFGLVQEGSGAMSARDQEGLILRNPVGYWGSLAEAKRRRPRGIDPRHSVWMWRRVLELLSFIHDNGWVHGDLRAENLLVHPGDHGVLIVDWTQAMRVDPTARGNPLHHPTAVRDLVQAAWTVRGLLHSGAADELPTLDSGVPQPLAALLKRTCEDLVWCKSLGARGLEEELSRVARESFGPPKFVPFDPNSPSLPQI